MWCLCDDRENGRSVGTCRVCDDRDDGSYVGTWYLCDDMYVCTWRL